MAVGYLFNIKANRDTVYLSAGERCDACPKSSVCLYAALIIGSKNRIAHIIIGRTQCANSIWLSRLEVRSAGGSRAKGMVSRIREANRGAYAAGNCCRGGDGCIYIQ